MKQVKILNSEKRANQWLNENQDKEIIDIRYSAGSFAVIYDETSEV